MWSVFGDECNTCSDNCQCVIMRFTMMVQIAQNVLLWFYISDGRVKDEL